MSDIDGAIGDINTALQDLRRAFDRTHDQWRDESRMEFSAQYIEPIMHDLEQASKSLTQISSVLTKLRSDCSST